MSAGFVVVLCCLSQSFYPLIVCLYRAVYSMPTRLAVTKRDHARAKRLKLAKT